MKRTEQRPWGEDELAAGQPVASFEIWPHRSLDARGTRILLAFAAVAGLVVFLGSPAPRALPLLISPLLAVGALAVAFRCNNRAAARTGEKIEIGPDVVKVMRRSGKGAVAPIEFSTAWVRLAVTQDRKVANRITLNQSGRSCSVGECLSPEERVELAKALEAALAQARGVMNAA
jgi:uncharacterized membrane protein